eukprot:TRINITY_DN9513_c0_g1_i1.p1 TRINITY_DN9513_c0_g1~~TRINITY_DN9513_c0_g1_i1.p1  ORF type:complete len:382 (+),score=96.01 TRINITY_DN9513_c0_g1_i1:26-1171(+)
MSVNLFSLVNAASGAFALKGYLAKAKDIFPHVNNITGNPQPSVPGTVEDFLKKHNDESLNKRAKNKVRKCPSCGKAVAFTMSFCNGCSADITKTEISYTNNVFVGFVYGIEKGPFPFTVSIRLQNKEYLSLDDILSLSPCHLNIIPTTQYIPDWRYLLKNPEQGKKIVEEMSNHCWSAVKEQFLGNKEWKEKIMKGNVPDEEIRSHVAAGFNYPPSQYQLHLQYILPPFNPVVYYQYQNGIHFTPGRFFPVEYVLKVLELNEKYDVKDDTPIETIIEYYKTKGVDYDAIHKECYDRYGSSHEKLSNWNVSDFEGIVTNGKFYKFTENGGIEETNEDVTQLNNKDKTTLQNYGRPYKDGKTSGSFYAMAKKFEDKDVFTWSD